MSRSANPAPSPFRAVVITGLALVAATSSVRGQDAAAVERGEVKYEHTCAPCHGAGLGDDGRETLPGTAALQIKYRGALPALLEERSDLTLEALRVYVRQGTMSMPPFRKTEVTDAELADIAAYLAPPSSN